MWMIHILSFLLPQMFKNRILIFQNPKYLKMFPNLRETFQKSRKIKMSQEEAGNEVHLGLPCGRPKTQNSGKNSNFGRISTLLRDQVVLYKKAWVNNSTFSL